MSPYGNFLLEKSRVFRATEALIDEAVTSVELHWMKTAWQLRLIIDVWDGLDEEHRDLQDRILRILQTKLEAAVLQISKVEKKYSNNPPGKLATVLKKGKYALLLKECLDTTLQELEAWQRKFDPSWYLIMTRASSPAFDAELVKADEIRPKSCATINRLRDSLLEEPQTKVSIFLPQDDRLASAQQDAIPFSTSKLLKRPGTSTLILESLACSPDGYISVLTKDVRSLAVKLRNVEPATFNLLKCVGVVKVRNSKTQKLQSFDFLFKIPEGLHSPKSLREVLLFADEDHSLSARLRIAQQLAMSVCYVHTLGFVHKNIRPESLVVFSDGMSPLGSLFLVGFDLFRTADGRTLRLGDSLREKNIYRHPDRQGLYPDSDYVMQHDIYSLGVCLLEIGLWESFVVYDGEDSQLPQNASIQPRLTNASTSVKDILTSLASNDLPKKMGDKYSQVVVNCLGCLDEDNTDFGDESEFEDEDGVLIAVKYIEKILLQLESISI